MSDQETQRLGLPLVQAAQAQKHVTVNESLARLDGLVNLVLLSTSRATPPTSALAGTCYGVPQGAGGAWAGQGGRIAIAVNGGWVFAEALAGMRAFIADQGAPAIHDGAGWVAGALTMGGFGAGLVARVGEAVVTVTPGAVVTTPLIIPEAAMVIGVTARVTEAITGTLSGWAMGTALAEDRFGKLLGLGQGSWARGMLSQPVTYWAPEPVILTATGGEFAGGKLHVAAHWLEVTLPR
ncbi:MAG: DUF2793 domain-containing protein [Paracoccus sp. (in: a-proteobacteria)]|nr:DUF2793 domain-containing protein [Paracoccus sp. (in: a-proteobacteria)]